MQYDHHMKKLAILYFEGKATDEEELRLLEFIKESARNNTQQSGVRGMGGGMDTFAHARRADRGCVGGAERKDEKEARRAGQDRRITADRMP